MTVHEKKRFDHILEYGYRHSIIVPSICRNHFKALVLGAPEVRWDSGIKLLSVGNSHIDAAWLWRKEDTRQKKIDETFSNALRHMAMYPSFTFTQNQAVYYAWTKELYPATWEAIKQRITEGRWEAVGGDWVECDANIPSGESLIRQRAAGQCLFLEEFGFVSEIAWADDVFGFPHVYPQILAKSGARYFYTNKFCYNEVTKFPYHAFTWKSPDGSAVLGYWMQHKNNWFHHVKDLPNDSPLIKLGMDVDLTYMTNPDALDATLDTEFVPVIGNIYGLGDGGHGPTPVEIIEQLSWEKAGYSKLGPIRDLFALLEPYRDRLPRWNDELYLECHQGTLTSIHMIKENNRTAEVLLQAVELLNVLATLRGNEDAQAEINEHWKAILFNQFHDVLPGSSIPEVYRDAACEYEAMFAWAFEKQRELSGLTRSGPDGGDNTTLAILNQLSWPRSGVITIRVDALFGQKVEGADRYEFSACDDDGFDYPCQVVSFAHHDANREFTAGLGPVTGKDYLKVTSGLHALDGFVDATNPAYLWVLVPEYTPIPPFGTRHVTISWSGPQDAKSVQEAENVSGEGSNHVILQNSSVTVHVDVDVGTIASISTKQFQQEACHAGLVLYDDPHTKFDAWNLSPGYYDHPIALPRANSHAIEYDGPVIKSVIVKMVPTAAGTTIYHRVYIVAQSNVVYHDVLVDWQEDHKLLKYQVIPAFESDSVRCGMQFGSITRDTTSKNKFTDYNAKYEYPVQQWASISGQIDGVPATVSLLNRNKYGIFTRGSTMELSLLKGAKFERHDRAATLDDDDPRPRLIDRGFWRLSVAIDASSVEDEQATWKSAEQFNQPFISATNVAEFALLPGFTITNTTGSIRVSAVKVLNDPPAGNNPHPECFLEKEPETTWVVFRLVEEDGMTSEATISFTEVHVPEMCRELDLLERVSDAGRIHIDSEACLVRVQVLPYEIKTVAIKIRTG